MAFVAAFFRLYAFIPISIYIISVPIVNFLQGGVEIMVENYQKSPLSIFTPAVFQPFRKNERRQLKTTMLISTLILLPCIVLIRLLPLLPPSTLHCTLGLSHLNINSEIPSCSPCFDLATSNLTISNSTSTSQTENNLTSTGDCLTLQKLSFKMSVCTQVPRHFS